MVKRRTWTILNFAEILKRIATMRNFSWTIPLACLLILVILWTTQQAFLNQDQVKIKYGQHFESSVLRLGWLGLDGLGLFAKNIHQLILISKPTLKSRSRLGLLVIYTTNFPLSEDLRILKY